MDLGSHHTRRDPTIPTWESKIIAPGIPPKMRDLCIPPGITGGIYISHLGSQAGLKSHAGSLVGLAHLARDLSWDLSLTWDPWWDLHISPGILGGI